MLELLFLIDKVLLQRFQKFSNWFQLVTGITCYQCAKFFLVVTTLGVVMQGVADILLEQWLGLLVVLVELWCILNITLSLNILESTATILQAKESKPDWSRPSIFILTVVVLIDVLINSNLHRVSFLELFSDRAMVYIMVGCSLTIYFASCKSRPKQKSKIKKWIESLSGPKTEPVLEKT